MRTTIFELLDTIKGRLSLLSREVSSLREYRYDKDEQLRNAANQLTIMTHVIRNFGTGLNRAKKSLSDGYLECVESYLQHLMGITDTLTKHMSEIRSSLKISVFKMTGPCKLRKAEDRLVSTSRTMVGAAESLRLLFFGLL